MWLALNLSPDADGLDGFIEETMPFLGLFLFVLALVLAALAFAHLASRFRKPSPVERLLKAKR